MLMVAGARGQFLNVMLIPFRILRFNHSSAWTLPDISIC